MHPPPPPHWKKPPHSFRTGLRIPEFHILWTVEFKLLRKKTTKFSAQLAVTELLESLHFILSLANVNTKINYKIKSLISHRERCKHNFAKYIYFWHLQSDVKAQVRTYTYSDFVVNAYFLNDIIQLMQR